jgi:hypothetical protein
MTNEGGNNNDGIIFSYDYTNSTYTKLFDLNDNTGKYPWGALLEVTEPTGIKNITASANIAIYPNPASDEITIALPALQAQAQLTIMDVTGRIVLSNKSSRADKCILNVQYLSAGAYLVEVRQNSAVYTGKFVKLN